MNRNKLIELFIANLSNAVLHKILEKAIDIQEISLRYSKEIINSWEIAKRYREKINPIGRALPSHDIEGIRNSIIKKVKVEINQRIDRGYENLDFSLVDDFVDDALKHFSVI